MPDLLIALWSRSNPGWTGNPAQRLAKLRQAVECARGRLNGSNVPGGQPIRCLFAAPEYLFTRDRGAFGVEEPRGLTEAEKESVVGDLMALSNDCPRMLIFPGTVAWKKPLVRPLDRMNKKDLATGQRTGPLKTVSRMQKVTAAFQTAGPVVARVGANAEAAALGSVTHIPSFAAKHNVLDTADVFDMKMFILRNTAYALLDGRVRAKYNKKADFHEAIGDNGSVFVPGARSGLFLIAGTTFGLEVCRDHVFTVLRDEVGAFFQADVPNPFLPDIHLVLSDWVDNYDASLVLKNGACFLHASTNAVKTVAKFKDGTGHVRTDNGGTLHRQLFHDSIDGCEIRYWRVTV